MSRTDGRRMRLAGAEIHVRDEGEGQPVLLCNGIGVQLDVWAPLLTRLEGVRVIAFDAPGTGGSETKLYPVAMSRIARMARELLDRLDIERADVIGYSFGGAVAQQLAIDAPDRVRRLVLAATMPGWGSIPGRLSAMLRIGSTMRPPSVLGYAGQVWTISTWTSLPFLRRITAPTLVVAGDDDPLVPLGNAMLLASRIPNARLHVGPGEGHFQLMDPTSTAVDAVTRFVTAADLATTPAWTHATQVSAADARDQARADGLGLLPWGAWHYAFRTVVP